ncbi:MAG TPA: 3-dehydroquinate synthase [Allosphingosinicella sp.]
MAAVKQIDVALGERSYPVVVGNGLLARCGELLAPFARDGRLVVVSDENVWSLYGERFGTIVNAQGIGVTPITVAAGEDSKSWATLSRLIDAVLDLGLERQDYLVAFGGGVVGDLTGFAAAILKRGCGYVHVPSTLLAQVDSSVGGKTAINVAAGKNLVGAFHPPSAVLIDPTLLDTLPPLALRAGYAEVVKYGLIGDGGFFGWCEANGAALLAGDEGARLHAVETSISARAAVIASDERDRDGRRALLNLGHTFAHALEAETGFSDRLLHGEAVAVGMALVFRFSVERGLCSPADSERVTAHLDQVGLPTSLAAAGIRADGHRLAAHMANDKKRSDGRLPFILVRGIGEAFVDDSVEIADVEAFLDREQA